jgi:hypothetical protein
MPLGGVFRGASTLKWYNMPGVVAAYAPVGAPNYVASKQNIANNFRMLNLHTATEGVAPTWTPQTGWGFNGTTQYFKTGCIPPNGTWSAAVQFRDLTATTHQYLFGSAVTNGLFLIGYDIVAKTCFYNGYSIFAFSPSQTISAGNLAFAGRRAYANGNPLPSGDIPAWTGETGIEIYVNGFNLANSLVAPANVKTQALLIVSRTLTASEVYIASQQMAHPENPEWNPWSRARNYYWIASSATTLCWPIIGKGIVGGKSIFPVQEI